jgi:hypothetical protein
MAMDARQILAVLDGCCDRFTFPMLDNGYVYLGATRLSLYRAAGEWAIIIETFGVSPQSWLPDTCIYTFASTISDREIPNVYGPKEISNLLAFNPNNDMRILFPIEAGEWQDDSDCCDVAENATELVVRGHSQLIPSPEQYTKHGISLERPPRVRVFELCRFLADTVRDSVLATPEERRLSIMPTLVQILQLEEWHHPNVVKNDARPSRSESFQQLAQVLETGNIELHRPLQPPNTHWSNWPDGGSL